MLNIIRKKLFNVLLFLFRGRFCFGVVKYHFYLNDIKHSCSACIQLTQCLTLTRLPGGQMSSLLKYIYDMRRWNEISCIYIYIYDSHFDCFIQFLLKVKSFISTPCSCRFYATLSVQEPVGRIETVGGLIIGYQDKIESLVDWLVSGWFYM